MSNSDEFFPGLPPNDREGFEEAYENLLDRNEFNAAIDSLIEVRGFDVAEIVIEGAKRILPESFKPNILLAQGKLHIAKGNYSDAKAPILESERLEAEQGKWANAALCVFYVSQAYLGLNDLDGLYGLRVRVQYYREQERDKYRIPKSIAIDITSEMGTLVINMLFPDGIVDQDPLDKLKAMAEEAEEDMNKYCQAVDEAIEELES